MGRKGPQSTSTPSLTSVLWRYVAYGCVGGAKYVAWTRRWLLGTTSDKDVIGASHGRGAFMRVKEVAELLDISESTALRLCREKQIACVRVRNQWRVPRKMLFRRLGIAEDDL